MKKLGVTLIVSFTFLISFAQVSPCVLTGASVYVDHNTTPPTMNATVNGMSQYSYSWTNGFSANQTIFYPGWCVSITDLVTGCDTVICENCIPIPNTCPCPFIYMPVCGCDGVMYSNYCLAECVGVGWTPAISNGMPGGFLPCTQPTCIDSTLINPNIMCPMVWNPVCGCDNITYSNDCEALNWFGVTSWTPGPCASLPPCSVDINNGALDIEICDGDTAILEATSGFNTYFWNTNDTTRIIEVTSSGIYTVIATDIANNCVDMDSIDVIVHQSPSLFIQSTPDPPIICLGDSVVLEGSSGFVDYWWVDANGSMIVIDDRLVDDPIADTWYMLVAEDGNNCIVNEDIWVYVDSCQTNVSNILEREIRIYPNPAENQFTIDLPVDIHFDLKLINMLGNVMYTKNSIRGSFHIDAKSLPKGTYIIQLISRKSVINKRLTIE